MGNRHIRCPQGTHYLVYSPCVLLKGAWYDYYIYTRIYVCMYVLYLLHDYVPAYSVFKDPNTLEIRVFSPVCNVSLMARKKCRLVIAESGWMLSTCKINCYYFYCPQCSIADQ